MICVVWVGWLVSWAWSLCEPLHAATSSSAESVEWIRAWLSSLEGSKLTSPHWTCSLDQRQVMLTDPVTGPLVITSPHSRKRKWLTLQSSEPSWIHMSETWFSHCSYLNAFLVTCSDFQGLSGEQRYMGVSRWEWGVYRAWNRRVPREGRECYPNLV